MTLTSPAAVQDRLEALDEDLARLQNEIEDAAMKWFVAKRQREKLRASSFLTAKGSIAARQEMANFETGEFGMVLEADYEAKRHVLKVLETRANVAMAILKSQGRS